MKTLNFTELEQKIPKVKEGDQRAGNQGQTDKRISGQGENYYQKKKQRNCHRKRLLVSSRASQKKSTPRTVGMGGQFNAGKSVTKNKSGIKGLGGQGQIRGGRDREKERVLAKNMVSSFGEQVNRGIR